MKKKKRKKHHVSPHYHKTVRSLGKMKEHQRFLVEAYERTKDEDIKKELDSINAIVAHGKEYLRQLRKFNPRTAKGPFKFEG